MTEPVRCRARLQHFESADPAAAIHVAAFALQEGYNTGWGGTAAVIARQDQDSQGEDSPPFTAGNMLGALMASGLHAGKPVGLNLVLEGGEYHGVTVRTWPCIVNGLRPYGIDQYSAACNVDLVDPVSFLAQQPIWGAYRAVSAGEMIGGALSLAAGGDGKPSLSPLLPGLPPIWIVEGYRDVLKEVPYAIAAGQTLGDWLAEFLAALGLRAELCGYSNGVVLELLDSVPRRDPLKMTVRPLLDEVESESTGGDDSSDEEGDGSESTGGDGSLTGEEDDESGDENSDGTIIIRGHSGFPGAPWRGGLLDDPTMGPARPIVAAGAVGTVLTGPAGLGVEESSQRIYRSLMGTYAEMLMLSALSRQPYMRPGELVRLSEPAHGLSDWQVAGVAHMLRGTVYDNDVTLLRGDVSWHPELPLHRPPAYVTALVDGGADFDLHQPVPRDRLGRIKVSFPFAPTPTGQEALDLMAADSNNDGRLTLHDYSDSEIDAYTSGAEYWEEQAAKYEAGEFDDPYHGMSDDMAAEMVEEAEAALEEAEAALEEARAAVLTAEAALSAAEGEEALAVAGDAAAAATAAREAAEAKALAAERMATPREELRTRREGALRYIAYRRAAADRDHDGVISDRDSLISDELSQALLDGDMDLQDLWESRQERAEARENFNETLAEGDLPDDDAREALVEEYGELFAPEEEQGALSEEVLAAREDAVEEADRWPPRIPLLVIKPMAGGLHGFIAAHRHGDACRVAVHGPLNAEIVGFQYREDRKINADLAGAVAGLVVEHDHGTSWSGLVFRRHTVAVDEDAGTGDGGSGTAEAVTAEAAPAEAETGGDGGDDGDDGDGGNGDGDVDGGNGDGGNGDGGNGDGGNGDGGNGDGGNGA